MNFKDCLRNGLIKKDPSTKDRVKKSIEIAIRFLESAKKNLEIEEFEMAEIAAYNSIFHSARSLLFNNGYIERSHVCLITALRFLYNKDQSLLDLLNTFDKIRISRHNVQYGGSLVNKEEAEFVIDFAKMFLEKTKEIIYPKK
jgi:uncharacterized protein (UPF0332 family)